jgi:hypothetical protein
MSLPGKITREKCKTCIYRAGAAADNNCNYIFIKRESRKSPADNCDKYERGPQINVRRYCDTL